MSIAAIAALCRQAACPTKVHAYVLKLIPPFLTSCKCHEVIRASFTAVSWRCPQTTCLFLPATPSVSYILHCCCSLPGCELCKQSYRRLELHLAEISFNTRNRDGGRGAKSNDRFPLKGMKFIQLKYTVKQGHSQCDCTMSRLVENTLDELLQKELTNTLYGYSQSLCFEIKEAKPPTDTGGPDGV